jgi:hypothetical protein
MRNAILPVLLSFSLISVKEKNVAGQGLESRPLSRHLMEDLLAKRHTHPIPDHAADPTYPKSIWSEFMLSPCRPEDSGHFGSTFGTPILLQYGFEMETSHFPNIEKALKIIDEKVMDALLSTFFPTICGFDDSQSTANPPQRNLADPAVQRYDAEITGFRFSKELVDTTRSCVPSMNKANYCGIFYSNIWVYGHKLNLAPGQVLRQARDAVNNSLMTVSNLGVAHLSAAENMAGQIQDELSTGDEYHEEIAIGALSGLVISSVGLILGVGVLVVYFRADRSKYQRVSRNGNGSNTMHKVVSRVGVALSDDDMTPTVTSFGSFRFFSPNGTHKDEDNDDDAESEISSVVVDPKLGTYRKMECDEKVTITFDPNYCSARSTAGSDVSSIAPDYLDADGRYSGF